MWQELRAELYDGGLEVVTVALDSAGPEAARPWIERARPQHPALIDEHHLLDSLFGIVNVPSGVWIDEAGVIVRPPEPAFSACPDWDEGVGEDATDYQRRTLALEQQLLVEDEKYVAAVRGTSPGAVRLPGRAGGRAADMNERGALGISIRQ